MIGKAKSNNSTSATIKYNEKNASHLFFKKNLVGDDKLDLATQIHDLQKCYQGNGQKLTIHAQLSPSIEDGKKLNDGQWQQIANKFLEKMGLSQYQCLGYLHEDKEHFHCHLVISRVSQQNFKLYNDSFVMLKAIKAADEIALEMGLKRAKEIQAQRKMERELRTNGNLILTQNQELVGAKQKYKAFLEAVLNQKHKDLESYFKAIEKEGYKVSRHKDKLSGELRGYGISKNGTYMDASAIDRKLTLKNIEKTFGANSQIIITESKLKTPFPENKISLKTSNDSKSKAEPLKDLAESILPSLAEMLLAGANSPTDNVEGVKDSIEKRKKKRKMKW